MDHFHVYHNGIPAFLDECMETPVVKRIKDIGMNCGCEYTSFPQFADLESYSRYDHSIGVALIVWHFTHDRKQAVAGLLHDVGKALSEEIEGSHVQIGVDVCRKYKENPEIILPRK